LGNPGSSPNGRATAVEAEPTTATVDSFIMREVLFLNEDYKVKGTV
jgi:hypothetical protein